MRRRGQPNVGRNQNGLVGEAHGQVQSIQCAQRRETLPEPIAGDVLVRSINRQALIITGGEMDVQLTDNPSGIRLG